MLAQRLKIWISFENGRVLVQGTEDLNRAKSYTVNTGIYVMDPKVFGYIEAEKMVDFSKEVFPRLLEENVGLFGFQADGYWSDIGNIQQYRQAQFDLLDGKVVDH